MVQIVISWIQYNFLKIDHIVIISTENWYRVLNQVLKLIIKPPGWYHLKNNTCIFTKILTVVDIWSTEQYNMLFRNVYGFPALGKFYIYSTKNTCNFDQLSSYVSMSSWKVATKNFWLISLSACNDTVIVLKIWEFPVLVWQTLPFHCYFWAINPSIWNIHSRDSRPWCIL